MQKNIFAPWTGPTVILGVTPYYLDADRSHNYTLTRDAKGGEIVRDNGPDFDPGITTLRRAI